MHFIVTGGSGFIGRSFVKRALAKGHSATVVGRTIPSGFAPEVAVLGGGYEQLVERPDLLESADAVCHLAWSSIPASSNADPLGDIDRNLRPTVALLEAMRRHGNRRMLFLSSGGAVYGVPRAIPISEDHPTFPISPYGISKLAAEKYLLCYRELHDFSPVIIRPANPYGPGQGNMGQLGAVWTFLEMIRQGRTATLFGDGSTVRDFVHVDDLCRLMLTTLESGTEGVFNCGGGVGTSLAELIAIVEQATGKTLAINRQAQRPFDPPSIVLDISKAQTQLGWSPQVALREGVEQISSNELETKT